MFQYQSAQLCGKALFHSSATPLALGSKTLTKSLRPRNSKAGHLEVAPKPSFERDDAPHRGRSPSRLQEGTGSTREKPRLDQDKGGYDGRRSRDGGSRPSFRRDDNIHGARSPRTETRRFGQESRRVEPDNVGRSRQDTTRRPQSSTRAIYEPRQAPTSHELRIEAGQSHRQAPFRRNQSDGHSDERRGRDAPYKSSFRRDDTPYRAGGPRLGAESYTQDRPRMEMDGPVRDKRPDSIRPSQSDADVEADYRPRQISVAHEEIQNADEFYHPPQLVTVSSSTKGKAKALASDNVLSSDFTSPPLLPGIFRSLKEMLGPDAKPTPIQSLSMKWLLENQPTSSAVPGAPGWRQFLLAAETGSGKSIAYLLPVLQNIKLAELADKDSPRSPPSNRPHNPRGLILAPTHELARQLSGFAKSLLHETKLRVMCASQSNVKSTIKQKDSTSSKMASMFQEHSTSSGEFQLSRSSHPVDLLVGTPMKLLEMVRGRGWDRKEAPDANENEEDLEEEEDMRKPRRGRDKMIGFGTWKSRPELGLANIEWVVVDEADVLFDPDFQETTRMLLSDISEARGHPIPVLPTPALQTPLTTAASSTDIIPEPITYPFNLLLTSATIPNSLNQYLEKYHPSLIRLASPRLHHLPKTLQTEYVSWTGGNKFADILRRIRRIWAEDAATVAGGTLSKVLVFCNKSAKVVELSAYFSEQGIKSVAMTSQSEHRGRGSNRHLDGFLRKRAQVDEDGNRTTPVASPTSNDVKNDAHVMVTTSLLSRGLDFSPEIKHVFIVDEPRNMVDFLHRAGRSGRAGQNGKVVVFGKMKGRGSQRGKDVRKRVGALVA